MGPGYLNEVFSIFQEQIRKLTASEIVDGDDKVNQKTLCTSRLPKRRICIVSGIGNDIKLKLSGNVLENVELNKIKNSLCIYAVKLGCL